MNPYEKKWLIKHTVTTLIDAVYEAPRDATLFELLEIAAANEQPDILISALMMIRGSKIDDHDEGIVKAANLIKAEDGFNDLYAEVAQRIDSIPDEPATAEPKNVTFPSQGTHPPANRLEPVDS